MQQAGAAASNRVAELCSVQLPIDHASHPAFRVVQGCKRMPRRTWQLSTAAIRVHGYRDCCSCRLLMHRHTQMYHYAVQRMVQRTPNLHVSQSCGITAVWCMTTPKPVGQHNGLLPHACFGGTSRFHTTGSCCVGITRRAIVVHTLLHDH